MLFGSHVSIAGGIENAPLNAAKIGCEVFQMFTRSPQGGPAPKITDEIVARFHANVRANGRHVPKEWVVHTPYYINLANAEARIRQNSVRIIREELGRASLIGARYVMFHPGSASGVGETQAMPLVIEGVKTVLDDYDGTARLLIEISAGAGMVIGDRFEEVAEIIAGVGHPDLGVCFDTAHAFASGYDLRDKKAVDATLKIFDQTIGLARLKMFHANDSKIELGGRRDRHEHIGDGCIGKKGFTALVRHPQLQDLNFYCETEPEGTEKDLMTLKHLRDR